MLPRTKNLQISYQPDSPPDHLGLLLNTMANFSCAADYILVGPDYSVCIRSAQMNNVGWSHQPPVCQRKYIITSLPTCKLSAYLKIIFGFRNRLRQTGSTRSRYCMGSLHHSWIFGTLLLSSRISAGPSRQSRYRCRTRMFGNGMEEAHSFLRQYAKWMSIVFNQLTNLTFMHFRSSMCPSRVARFGRCHFVGLQF